MTVLTKRIQNHWTTIAPLLTIRNEREYDQAVNRLNNLLDEIGDDERHPQYELLDTLGTLIQAYEATHYPVPECSALDSLRFLIEEHGVMFDDLPEVGSRDVVIEVLNGRQELNLRQVRALARRFHVSPSVFI